MQQRKRTDYIAIHCSATKASMDIGTSEIRQWHKAKGWQDIGYHYVIRRSGIVEIGRPEMAIGAHVEGFNDCSVGVCLVGGIDAHGTPEDNFTPAQYATLKNLLAKLGERFPGAIIRGHREFPNVKKACPSFDVRSWLKDG